MAADVLFFIRKQNRKMRVSEFFMVDLLLAPMHAMLEASYFRAYFCCIQNKDAHTLSMERSYDTYTKNVMFGIPIGCCCCFFFVLLFYKRTFHMPFAGRMRTTKSTKWKESAMRSLSNRHWNARTINRREKHTNWNILRSKLNFTSRRILWFYM